MNGSEGSASGNDTEHMTIYEVYFYIINGTLGTLFNAVVLLIALRHADTYDKPRQIAVINMTFADLITCLIYMITRPFINLVPEQFCYSYYVTIFTSQMCSCLNLLWLNLDKLIYIKFPLHYYTMVSRTRVLALTAISWLSIVLLALAIYSFMIVRQPCSIVSLSSPFLYSVICLMYIAIILASFAISAIIYFIARNSRRNEPQQGSKMFKRLFFVFSSTIWTCITCLPYRLLYLTFLFCPHAQQKGTDMNSVLTSLITAFFPVVVIGIVINPWITILTQRMYRESVIGYARKAASFLGICGSNNCPLDNSKARRQSRPSLATQRTSAASRNEIPECKRLNDVDV